MAGIQCQYSVTLKRKSQTQTEMIISNKRENPSICFTLQLEIFHKFVENLDKKAEQTFTWTITINSESHYIKKIYKAIEAWTDTELKMS